MHRAVSRDIQTGAGDTAGRKPVPAGAEGVAIKKLDADLQVVWGEVYAPGFPDSQGDFATVEQIRGMMHRFMKAGRLSKIDTAHSQIDNGACVVECFQARDSDPDFIPGSWVMGVWIPDDVWPLVKSGELNGFSIDGMAVRVPTTLELEIPDELGGETDNQSGHSHRFVVKFDDDGTFLGGSTDTVNGHCHQIFRGTVTEPAGGHSHRFSFVEGVLSAQASN